MGFKLVPEEVPTTTREGVYYEIVKEFHASGLQSVRVELDADEDGKTPQSISIVSGLRRSIEVAGLENAMKAVQRKDVAYLELV
jgi:hypothetical protein